ncbi:hypothetical protein RvY_03664 [Ramazzottius varieornatus]|uniref:SCP domain-containing protein n=1 Tax=Ramazzottius varieornatus TaxID=947166 RepID=A0A1D1UNW2_RAMVA|nr:hypothetical protein RvY_03664 [Ramazzottius varieornatus]
MLSAVILLGLACGSPSYVHGASLDDSFMAPEVRISAREDFIRALSLPYIGCRPDAFPNLRIAGFCSDVTNLDAICSGLEVSVAASACSQVQGSFCCYISIAQGNTLNPVSSTIQVPTTRVSTVVSTVPSSVATTVASTAGTNTQNPTSVPATTASAFTQTSTATAETSRPGGSSTSVTVTGTASVNTGATTAATTPVSGTTTTAQNPAATTSVSTTRAPTPTSAPTQPPTQTPTQPPTAAPTQPLTPAPTAVSTPATTTTTTTNPVSPDCVNSLNPACPNVKQQILDLLNAERRAQGAADMLKLVWDDRAAQVAQQWADGCSYLHGPEDPNRPTSTFSTSGQNIGRGYTQWGDLINDWNSEKRFVTVGQACPTPSPTLQTGHWTQVPTASLPIEQ